MILSISKNAESLFIRFIFPRLYSFLFSLRPAGSISLTTTGDKAKVQPQKYLPYFMHIFINTCPVVVVIRRNRPLWFPSQLAQIDFRNLLGFLISDTSRGKWFVYTHVQSIHEYLRWRYYRTFFFLIFINHIRMLWIYNMCVIYVWKYYEIHIIA